MSDKTSSLVIDTLHDQASGQNIAVLPLYCDYQAQKEQSAVNMIGGLLRQVDWRAAGVQREIRTAFHESNRGGWRGLRMPEMLKLFVKVTGFIGQVYICVDAVDELLPQNRLEFLRALRQVIHYTPNTRLFLTARSCIRAELGEHLVEDPYTIRIMADQGDIVRYLNRMLDDDRDMDLMTEDLRNNIIETILGMASGMYVGETLFKFGLLIDILARFSLAALSIAAILGETTLAGRKKMLRRVEETGVDLDSVYAQTLQRIREQAGDRSRLGIEVLMWVSHAERPLRIDELCNALAVEMEMTDLDPENIRLGRTILGSCLGLVVIDARTSTLRLIHYTLQEYLSHSGNLLKAHETLAETCLAYLNYEQVMGLPTNRIPHPQDMPFFEYSSIYWGSHAKRGLSYRSKSLALELLTQYDNHVSATLLFNQMQSFDSPPVTNHLFTGLHCASYFGIVEAVAALIEVEGCDINKGDCKGFTPLMWAARRGNEAVVRLLLTRGDLDLHKQDNDGNGPEWHASSNGHQGVMALLPARRNVNPGRPGNYVKTPHCYTS